MLDLAGEALVYILLGAVLVCVACAAICTYCAVRVAFDARNSLRTLTAIGQAANEVRLREARIGDMHRSAVRGVIDTRIGSHTR